MSDPYRSAVVAMPTAAQLGGEQPLPFVRFPFYPTAPWYSTNPNVGYQVRWYSMGVTSADSDWQTGGEMTRSVQFDLPVRLIAINGAMVDLADPARFTEVNMNNGYLIRIEYSIGDKLTTTPRLASTVVGIGKNPGEIGGHGYNIDQGGSLQVGITPLFAPTPGNVIRIDVSFVCLEMRAPRNFAVR